MEVPGYDRMDHELEWTGDSELSVFHVTRMAVFEYCVAVTTDPAHSVSTVMFVISGGVASMNTPLDVVEVVRPALLMATMWTYTVMLVGRREGRGWRSEDVEGGRVVGGRRESSPGHVPAHTV